ncbi:alpha/beta hydrolase [Hoyosella sp. YIM 151337]|uniref:alpha/beta hydrolase n=1 Tax=Hoyosella sp. YIM 151337 TaxID=2992742 RepID=UPI0022357D99|nr:alpha/beta hydrolase [Hoyosella sp. YIM 151337]MCW4353278.1 alpha/beta hydrolase [Hoyosella sp. YIM 151337]
MRNRAAAVLILLLTACLLGTACGAAPSNRPEVAIDYGPPPAGPGPDTEAGALPELDVPQVEMGWQDCTTTVLGHYELQEETPGLTLECASFTVPADPSGQVAEWLNIGLTRARMEGTSTGAAPLVLTTGTSQPSSRALAAMAASAGPILEERPIVAIDRRGTGLSDRVSCFTRAIEEQQLDLGAGPGRDPVDAATTVGRDSTLGCTDHIDPMETLFSAANAAADLEALRTHWGVDRLALAGIGDGATVALAYASMFPGHLSRLILDSVPAMPGGTPTLPGSEAMTTAEQQAQGAEAALTVLASHCLAIDCALGPDLLSELRALLSRAAEGQVWPLTPGALVSTITGVLGDNAGTATERMDRLIGALEAARNGSPAELVELSFAVQAFTGDDGQFVGRCSDITTRAVPENVREVLEQWNSDYPHVGETLALRQLLCVAWPALDPIELPSEISAPVLLAEGANDAWVGDGTAADLRGPLQAGGAPTYLLRWQGTGHGVVLHSECGANIAAAMITTGALPADNTCPA